MALDATPGGALTNSYTTVAEANAYFETRLHSTEWDACTDPEAALITASKMLDWYSRYKGIKATETQAMAWPRIGAIRADSTEIDSTVIPPELKIAVFEMALSSVEEDPSLDSDLAGLSEIQAGSVRLKTANGIRPRRKKALPERVSAILRDLVTRGGIGVVWLDRA